MTVASWASFMVPTGIDACCKNLLKEAEPREFARLPNALGGDSQTSGCLTPRRRKSNERLPNALAATIGSDAAASRVFVGGPLLRQSTTAIKWRDRSGRIVLAANDHDRDGGDDDVGVANGRVPAGRFTTTATMTLGL